MIRWQFLPGLLLLLALAIVSSYASELVVMGGKHPLEASALAVILGIFVANVGMLPQSCKPGIFLGEKLLVFGIVLMGAGLNIGKIATQGPAMLAIILVTMSVGFFLIYILGKLFTLPPALALLLAVGTTICGTTAIAITAPLIKAPEEETSYAVGTVALWGLVAILLYPYLGHLMQASDFNFGVFAGTAIHSTPQVIGAGFIYSDIAGQTATAVKLVRNCFIAPVAILIAMWFAHNLKTVDPTAKGLNLKRVFPWFLFGYFFMAACNSFGLFSTQAVSYTHLTLPTNREV